MRVQTYLHIPTPCHEDWDKMSPNQQGRHCESCCKTVVDFEMMTDQQVLNFFATAKGETCGRFGNDQLNRALVETKFEKKRGWQWFMASVASFFFFVSKSNAQGSVLVEKQKQAKERELQQRRIMGKLSMRTVDKVPSSTAKNIECTEQTKKGEVKADTVFGFQKTAQLIGSVTDEKGNPIAGVTVSTSTKKGQLMFATNEAGDYFVNNPIQLNEEIELKFSSMGYEDKVVPLTFDESQLELHVQLKEKPKQLDEVVVVDYQRIKRTSYTGGAVAIVCTTKMKAMDTVSTIIKKIFKAESFKIFPNPASKGKAVNLTINEAGEYSVQLLDNESRLVNVQNVTVSNKQEIKLFNIPSTVSSGMYYIRLVNEKTKKQYIDKLLVQ